MVSLLKKSWWGNSTAKQSLLRVIQHLLQPPPQALELVVGEEPVDLLRRATAAAPAHGNARAHLARALTLAGRPDEARAEYELAVKRRPSSPVARDALGRFLTATGSPDAAVPHLAEAAYLDPAVGIAAS